MGNYQEIINILKSDEYYSVNKIIYKLINDSGFIKLIINSHNPLVFDRFIKMVEFKMDTSIIYEMRNRFIEKSLFSLNKENIYSFFELQDLDESRQKIISDRYLTEYIIGYYYQDNYYNFMTNFYQMIRYLDRSKKRLINQNHINLYRDFVELKDMSFEDKIKLFERHLNNNLMGMFYDDITLLKEDSHKSLVDSSLKLDKNNEVYQVDISKKFGVDVYYLDGEDFYGFIRHIKINNDDTNNQSEYVYAQRGRLGYSFSFISSKNISTLNSGNDGVILYYDNIDYKNIMYVHHTDMHSGKVDNLNTYLTDKENEIVTPDSLISSTVNYNEIYVKSNREGIKPKALVCYDNIKEKDILFAKEYNLSILLINTKKYKKYDTYDDNIDDYTYVL